MKERERLQAVGNLITNKREDRKERLKAKIRARVKLRLQKELAKVVLQMTNHIDRLKLVQQELEEFNPRFNQLQIHTKAKWSTELQGIILGLTEIVNKAPKG